MKKSVFWMALISLVVMTSSTMLTSCNDNDDEKNGSLAGEWLYGEESCYFLFDEDGKWWTKDAEYNDTYSQEGTYIYKNGFIEFSYLIPDEPIWGDKWKVIKLTDSELVAEATDDGETFRVTLKRVK
jgi:hypothetical protein